MYTLVEFSVVAGITVCLGAGLFLTCAAVVLLTEGVKVAITKAAPLASRATVGLGEKLDAPPLAHAAGPGK